MYAKYFEYFFSFFNTDLRNPIKESVTTCEIEFESADILAVM